LEGEERGQAKREGRQSDEAGKYGGLRVSVKGVPAKKGGRQGLRNAFCINLTGVFGFLELQFLDVRFD
jgi:hypothetical protein